MHARTTQTAFDTGEDSGRRVTVGAISLHGGHSHSTTSDEFGFIDVR